MLRKGIEDERKAMGGVKENDWGIKCFIFYPFLPLLSPYSSVPRLTQSSSSRSVSRSLSAQVPGHFGGT